MLGKAVPVAVHFWDGSALGPLDAPSRVVVRSPDAVRWLLYAPHELGFGRAYVAGDLDVEGDLYNLLDLRERIAGADDHAGLGLGAKGWWAALRGAGGVGGLGLPLRPPPEEIRLSGCRHSRARDAAAIAYHYDVSNEFYRLVLGETMTYSCAYFTAPGDDLDTAQAQKYELICTKLGLRPGMRLLDVGCGWGGMVIHAALHHGVEAVGVTVSHRQWELASKRVADAGLAGQVEIRLADYRDVTDGPYDAISSIGMFEHVGLAELSRYFGILYELLAPTGRLLNHGISRPPGPSVSARHSFMERYVFPDGELHEVGAVVSAMQRHGFEVRDVESLREHYDLTLRRWVSNLEQHWERAQGLVGAARARIWRLYMAASALNFGAGRTNLHQVLSVKRASDGSTEMPLTRAA